MTSRSAKTIGPYELGAVIGSGGMGSVHRARDTRSGRPVAVKLLHPALRRNAELVERFREEAEIQARLRHPGIVGVLDFVEDSESLGMVLELVDGRSLSAILAEKGAAPGPTWAVDVTVQLLEALAFAHEQGIVHRDVKPSNVLVLEVDGRVIARLMDFGVAKVLGSEKARTVAGSALGTLAYMSPEQIRSPRDVDARADLYAVGITLYQMLAGALPFDGDTEFGLMEQIVKSPPRPLPAIGANGDAHVLEPILQRALAKAREDRFGDARAFVEALVEARPRLSLPPHRVANDSAPSAPSRQGPVGADSATSFDEAQRLFAQGIHTVLSDLRHLSDRLAAVEAPGVLSTASEQSAAEILHLREELEERMAKLESALAPIAEVGEAFREIARLIDDFETMRGRIDGLERLAGRLDLLESAQRSAAGSLSAHRRDLDAQGDTVSRLADSLRDLQGRFETLEPPPAPEPVPDLLPRLQQLEARFGVLQGFVERQGQRMDLLEPSSANPAAAEKPTAQLRESIEEIVGAIRELRLMEEEVARLRPTVKRLDAEVRQLAERLA